MFEFNLKGKYLCSSLITETIYSVCKYSDLSRSAWEVETLQTVLRISKIFGISLKPRHVQSECVISIWWGVRIKKKVSLSLFKTCLGQSKAAVHPPGEFNSREFYWSLIGCVLLSLGFSEPERNKLSDGHRVLVLVWCKTVKMPKKQQL